MTTKIQLREFSLRGDWSPLLSRLDGWKPVGASGFSDGESLVTLSMALDNEPKIGFLLSRDANDEILNHSNADENFSTRVSASGLVFRIGQRASRLSLRQRPRFLMNHAAFQVASVDSERAWLEGLLGRCTVLARASTWDPVAKKCWPDAHLFRPPDFYLTLRGGFARTQVDHVGWMTYSPEAVNQAATVLRDIQWPILLGPAIIDGSYLVHFRGPDARVHDFFFPTEAIVPGTTRHEAR